MQSRVAFADKVHIKTYFNPAGGVPTEQLVFGALRTSLAERFSISEEQASLERALSNIERGDGDCVRSLLPTERRRQSLLFSEPVTYFLGLRVFVSSQSNVEHPKHQVSLQALLQQHPQLVIGLEKDRSYGDQIDALLSQVDPARMYQKDGSESTSQLHAMLLANRFDVLIEYPTVMEYHNVQKSIAPQNRPVPLDVEGLPALLTGHVACKDTPENQQFISELNKALTTMTKSDEYLAWHLQYIEPGLRESFLTEFKKIN